jgi:hypothetical protein
MKVIDMDGKSRSPAQADKMNDRDDFLIDLM